MHSGRLWLKTQKVQLSFKFKTSEHFVRDYKLYSLFRVHVRVVGGASDWLNFVLSVALSVCVELLTETDLR